MNELLDHHLIFDSVGGEAVFEKITELFYEGVAKDEKLSAMYPESFDVAKMKLKLFLIQKFGGPDNYTPLRGHPRMRMRHMKFPIDLDARNRWVNIMKSALDQAGIDADHVARYTLDEYFSRMASHMINQSDFQFGRIGNH